MTSQIEELQERLNDLQSLSRKKKCQLAKPEHDEAIRVLSALCAQDSEGFAAVVRALPDFPSEVGTDVLAANWERFAARGDPIMKSLQGNAFATDLGKRLRLGLAQRLATRDPKVALRIMVDVTQMMKPARKTIPTAKDLAIISAAILEPGFASIAKLPLAEAMDTQASVLVAYILSAAFEIGPKGRPLASTQTQLAVLRWASAYAKLGELPEELSRLISTGVQTWDDDFRKLLSADVDTFHPVLRGILLPLTGSQVSARPPKPLVQQESRPEPPPPTQPEPVQLQPQSYDPLYEIGRLANHVKQLQSRLRKTEQELAKATADWHQADGDLKNTRREREEARRAQAIARDEASQAGAQRTSLAAQVATLTKEMADIQAQCAAAKDALHEEAEKHRKQMDALSERISKEGENRITAYRNRLAAALRPFSANFREAREMEMTAELGQALRTQLKQILRLLKAEGVPVDGDEP